MSCPTATISGCDFGQFLVQQTPVFDELILEDITPIDGWLGNISSYNIPMGEPVEVTQDRFRTVWPNTARPWNKTAAAQSCVGTPCDPTESQIGWGSDRLTYFEEDFTLTTPLVCFDQMMLVTHAQEQFANIINKTLRPATSAITSMFLRKRTLFWAKQKIAMNKSQSPFTFNWTLDANGNESYFDCNIPPTSIFKLVPQFLQNQFSPLMRIGYAGENPFKDTAPFIELVTDMDTCWNLEHLGGQQGVGGGDNPNVIGNWRFEQFNPSMNQYWRYGFSGQLGNYMVRVDELGLRFNFVAAIGGGQYRYQLVLPYVNDVTTGAGGSAGLGRDFNPDFDKAQYSISFISHKRGLELGVRSARAFNAEMPFLHPDFAGKWSFLMNNLGADANGVAINNKWGNKGQFGARFHYKIRPLHTEFLTAILHKREQFCIPEIDVCSASPGYPAQSYRANLPTCPIPSAFNALYGSGVPTGSQDGPVPQVPPGDQGQPPA